MIRDAIIKEITKNYANVTIFHRSDWERWYYRVVINSIATFVCFKNNGDVEITIQNVYEILHLADPDFIFKAQKFYNQQYLLQKEPPCTMYRPKN